MNEVVREITESSNIITTWSMSILAASILAILSTSYIRPAGKWSKLIYLLFLPGWIYLACSINSGNIISRRQIMAIMNPVRTSEILNKMNDDFACQLRSFNLALIFFGIWLALFLLWWIIEDFFKS